MANKSNYHRSFIILKSKSKGYGLVANKAPAGYCKFEIRRGVGKAYIYVQDIKPSSSLEGIYEAYLVSADYSIRPCKLASLHVNEQGHGEHIATFDADDIMGTGFSLENFHALAIAYRSRGDGEGIRIAYPLIGYSSRNVNIDTHRITESLKFIHGEEIEIESEISPEEERETPTEPEPELEDMVENGSEIPGEGKISRDTEEPQKLDVEAKLEEGSDSGIEEKSEGDKFEEDKFAEEKSREDKFEEEKSREDKSEEDKSEISLEEGKLGDDRIPELNLEPLTTYTGQNDQRPIEPENEDHRSRVEVYRRTEEESKRSADDLKRAYEDSYRDYLQDLPHEDRTYASSGHTYWENVKDYFTGLFRVHQRITPFDNELKHGEWIRVQHTIPVTGGYYAEAPYSYPYYSSSYPDHYIVGLIKDKDGIKHIIYGVPSMYSILPPVSINGFSRWVAIKEGYGMGYWLLYIDAISGRIVYPH